MNKKIKKGDLGNPRVLANMLLEHNKWRRGIGKYRFSSNPLKNADPPFAPSQLTLILNATVDSLRRLSKIQELANKWLMSSSKSSIDTAHGE